MKFLCSRCGTDYAPEFVPLCTGCGSLVDAAYELDRVLLHESTNPYLRFRDLLPVRDSDLLPGGASVTPVVHSPALSRRLGMPRVFIKNETVLPTGTTKDRNAGVVLALLWECGVRDFSTASTGNSASAYIRELARYPDMKMALFTGQDFFDRVRASASPQLAWYALKDGTFTDAGALARKYAARTGITFEEGFFNFGKREGAKLTFFEAVEQIDGPIDWYVQAVSSGLGAYGVHKGTGELLELGIISGRPGLLCVQQASCAPMVHAYNRGSGNLETSDIVAEPMGIAEAILNGNPARSYPYLKTAVDESSGGFVEVDEKAIRSAKELVRQTTGIDPCYSAASAVAGLIEARGSGLIAGSDTVLINLTGEDRRGTEFSALRWIDQDWIDGVEPPDTGDRASAAGEVLGA